MNVTLTLLFAPKGGKWARKRAIILNQASRFRSVAYATNLKLPS